MDKSKYWSNCLLDIESANGYLKAPEEYVRMFCVRINGKLRHLITYRLNEKGRALRNLHTNFAKFLGGSYKQARSSYAYRKGKNILDCVKRHLKSDIFLKTDIHAYFDSVTYANMIERIKTLRLGKAEADIVSLITEACFYEGRLPLGFTSSPVLSDLFLEPLDREYQKNGSVMGSKRRLERR